jgi:GNAT superfamily N-acetyltransferase
MTDPNTTHVDLFLSLSPRWHTRFTLGDLALLSEDEEFTFYEKRFDFVLHIASDPAAVRRRLGGIAGEPGRFAVVVSDGLVERSGGGELGPSGFTRDLRESFRASPSFLGLVALAPGESGRMRDVNRVVSAEEVGAGEAGAVKLRNEITRVAEGLLLRAPPDRAAPAKDAVIRVHPVASRGQMEECLRLRYDVYDLLGYLDTEVTASGAGIDLDSYDPQALHFAAVENASGKAVGTVRLILPGRPVVRRGRLFGSVGDRVKQFEAYCRQVADASASAYLTGLINDPPPASLPIFRSFDFRQWWLKKLVPVEDYAELSRLVVNPAYRGAGVSRLLTRAVIATALDLGRKTLLLECTPFHGPMYEKYGFVTMDHDGTRYFSRVQDLDVEGQGMRLDLEKARDHPEVAAARRTLEAAVGRLAPSGVLAKGDADGARFCCLCGKKDCWGGGAYPLWSKTECPLGLPVAAAAGAGAGGRSS